MMRSAKLFAILFASIALGTAGAARAELNSCDKPIVFGTTISQTGPFSTLAEPFTKMTTVFADEINAAGGVKLSGCGGQGVPIKWVIYDDQSNPSVAVTMFEKMATSDNVDFFVGVDWSPIVGPASLVAERHNIPVIAGSASTPSLYTRGLKNFWATSFPQVDGWSTDYMAMLSRMDPKPKTIFFATHDHSTMKALTGFYSAEAKKMGLTIVGQEIFSQDLKDFTPIVIKMRSAKPDIIFIASYDNPSVPLVQQMRQMRIRAMDVHHVMLSGALARQVGKDVEGMTGDLPWLPGVKGAYGELAQRVLEKSNINAFDYIFVSGRMVAYVVALQALERAGEVDREKFREALYKGKFDTFLGPIQFDERGYTSAPAMTIQMQDGEVKVVSPSDKALAKMKWPSPTWQ